MSETTNGEIIKTPESNVSLQNNPAEDASADKSQGSVKVKQKVKKEIDSMFTFIEFVLKGGRLTLTDKIFRALRDNPLNGDDREFFLESAAELDLNLDIARQLMSASVHSYSYPRVTGFFRLFAKEIMARHPVVGAMVSDACPDPTSDSSTRFSSIAKRIGRLRSEVAKSKGLVHSKAQPEKVEKGQKKVSRDDAKAYENLLFASASWWFVFSLADPEEIVSGVTTELFPFKLEGKDLLIKVLSFAEGVTDRKGFGAYCQWQASFTEQLKNRNTSLANSLEKISEKSSSFEKKYNELGFLNSEMEKKIQALELDVAEEKKQRHIEKTHLLDEKEKLKSHALRTIEADLKLLVDAQTALKKTPPKIEVTENYLDTVIESLTGELNFLKGA